MKRLRLILHPDRVGVLLVKSALLVADCVPCLVNIHLLIRCVKLVAVGIMFLDYGLLVL